MRYSKRFEVFLPLDRTNVDLQQFCSKANVKEYAYILHKNSRRPHYHLYVHFNERISDLCLSMALGLPNCDDGGKCVLGLCFIDLVGRSSAKDIVSYFLHNSSATDLYTNIDLSFLFDDISVK